MIKRQEESKEEMVLKRLLATPPQPRHKETNISGSQKKRGRPPKHKPPAQSP
jgi:hypothetical protein